jgi:6,7-dimethyl-8-ribityllumazine synthase
MTMHFAIVVSEFNNEITAELLNGAQQQLLASAIPPEHIEIFKVPGAVEIPLVAQLLAKKHKYDAIICLGAVIRGDTDHYDYVCEQVSQGCQRVMLDHAVPVIFGILTTNTEAQAYDRIGGKEGHKGVDAANAALQMVKLVRTLAK